jgi:hypothetical protein
MQRLAGGQLGEHRGLLLRSTAQDHRTGSQEGFTTLPAAQLHWTALGTARGQGGRRDQGKAEHSDRLQRAEDWHQMSS